MNAAISLLIMVLISPLGFSNATLEVSSNGLHIELNPYGSVKSVNLDRKELNLVGDALFWIMDLTNFLSGRNLLPKIDDGVS